MTTLFLTSGNCLAWICHHFACVKTYIIAFDFDTHERPRPYHLTFTKLEKQPPYSRKKTPCGSLGIFKLMHRNHTSIPHPTFVRTPSLYTSIPISIQDIHTHNKHYRLSSLKEKRNRDPQKVVFFKIEQETSNPLRLSPAASKPRPPFVSFHQA